MNITDFSKEDFWRAIILYGLNQSTYKIALGQSLISLAHKGKNKVSMNELAVDFFDIYFVRLKKGKPQLAIPHRQTAMERIITKYQIGKISLTEAIEMVEREAFNDVIDRFHTVDRQQIPLHFFEKTKNGLVVSDYVFEIFSGEQSKVLTCELESRWDLLEAAFEIKRNESTLINDIRNIYLLHGHERSDITKNRPVLNGYQNNVCFYCGEVMPENDVHVDHFIARQFINHDHIWNLVLSHSYCNMQKSDSLPDQFYVDKLTERNEYFIKSNHPISGKLKEHLGMNKAQRIATIRKIYNDAEMVLAPWKGINGYNPSSDPFYKSLIKNLMKVSN